MISIFPPDANDFSTNGLCALAPSSCLVNETLNGEWELQLVHPLDDRDKWSWLQVGSIVKAPVPAAMTPCVRLIRYVEWLVSNTNAQFLPTLNAVMTAPEIARMSVEQNILDYSMLSRIQAGISREDLAQAEKLKGMLASGDVGKYGSEEAGLARFRQEVAPYMTIMTSPYPVTYYIQQDYLDGKLDADAFIKALQEAAK